ncbi:MAG: GNAT family N-acetyltransferase [Gemmatimonadota bacterium]|nr:GNAT family N-acetyltransferase [Gemmatimonadota bacterium]
MIRPATREDSAAVIDLVIAVEMFSADDARLVEGMLAEYFDANKDDGHVCMIDDEGGPLGVAYYQPESAADRVWDLTMIAVQPDRQGQGHGAAMLRRVEEDLRARGQRLLLVDTSASPQYDRTRAFYVKCGYEEEARIRNYWTAGDDLVVFRKALNAY